MASKKHRELSWILNDIIDVCIGNKKPRDNFEYTLPEILFPLEYDRMVKPADRKAVFEYIKTMRDLLKILEDEIRRSSS